uniref:Protein boule-like n=1 Tax=Coilia nasus TaxID=365059 RepID=A0A8G1GN23_COINA|nr:boule [Coilia nasus]
MDETSFISNQTQSSSPPPSSASPHQMAPLPVHHAPRYGTVIPNRIFVGGIDTKTSESDLRRFFSHYGAVREVKIVIDRAGVSKGYGFVTFETEEDAQKVLQETDRLSFRDKTLNIGQAIRKQQVGMLCGLVASGLNAPLPPPTPCSTMYLTTPTGYPYTYHNGVAYFQPPDMAATTTHTHWPSHSVSGSPAMVAPPVYPQPAYHHAYQTPGQCVIPSHHWGISQCPVASSPMMYQQPSELHCHPVEMAADGGCAQPSMPLTDPPLAEQTQMDVMVQTSYQHIYLPSPAAPGAIMMHRETTKEHKFHSSRRGFPHSFGGRRSGCGHISSSHVHNGHAPTEPPEIPAPQTTELL